MIDESEHVCYSYTKVLIIDLTLHQNDQLTDLHRSDLSHKDSSMFPKHQQNTGALLSTWNSLQLKAVMNSTETPRLMTFANDGLTLNTYAQSMGSGA